MIPHIKVESVWMCRNRAICRGNRREVMIHGEKQFQQYLTKYSSPPHVNVKHHLSSFSFLFSMSKRLSTLFHINYNIKSHCQMRSFSIEMNKWNLLLCTVYAYKNKSLTLYIKTCRLSHGGLLPVPVSFKLLLLRWHIGFTLILHSHGHLQWKYYKTKSSIKNQKVQL